MKRPILVNAVAMSRVHPKTFSVPDTAAVGKGTIVKVSDDEERFWVEVTDRCGDVLTGLVRNEIVCSGSLDYGDVIQFHVDNVYSIWEGGLK
jgi:hypothetical protein